MHAERCASMRVYFVTALLLFAVRLSAATAEPEFSPEELTKGRKLFTVHCARCHGMQGLGGTGPSLTRATLTQAKDYNALMSILEFGIPGTAMPPWRFLIKRDQRAIAGFVHSIGVGEKASLPGDAARGRELFAKAACTQCHSVAGEGGVKGPDLTLVGMRRGADRLRAMLINPGVDKMTSDDGYFEYLPVRVVGASGHEVEGLRVNEDGFTLQVRDLENRLHSFRKSEIKEIQKGFGKSIMPSFANVFTAAELDDLVAYLANLRGKK
jgi:cytochrome c oxidase cbb3-type subunit III